MRELRVELGQQRAVIREHPLWDSARAAAERKATLLKGRIADVNSRRPPEEWRARLLASGVLGEQIVNHYPEATGPLEIFDQARRCQKCGGKAATEWIPDRLQRTCRRCGFKWTELPLDGAEAPDTEEPPAQPEG